MIMKPFTNEILPQGYKMTELGPLPEEWEVIRLGEVCKVDWGNTSLTKKLYTANGYPAFSAAGNDGFLDFYEHDGEAVILSAIGARSGKCFYASGKWTAIKNTIVIKSNNETKINLLFLYFFVNNENYWHKSGSGQPFISIGVAQKQKLPLPPLPEQQKMAAVLSAVQEAKEKTRAVIAATKALKKSMMKHLFTYGPVPPEETENVPLKETEIGKVPEDWEVVKLGEVVREKITDGTHKTPQYIENGIPFITITNLVNGKIDFSKCRFISEEEHNFLINRCKPEKDDVLLSKVGTLGLTAKICEKDNFSIFVQLALIKPKKEIINSDFLTYMLNSISIQNQIEIKSSQSTMKYIGVEKISQLQIPLPPLPVQQKIASILSAIDAKIEAEENKKKSLEKLFKTLLHNLMTAKIRVNHLEIKV